MTNEECSQIIINIKSVAEQAEYCESRKLTQNECYEVIEELIYDYKIMQAVNEKIVEVVKRNDPIIKRNRNAEKTLPHYEIFGAIENTTDFEKLAVFKNIKDAKNYCNLDLASDCDIWKIFLIDKNGDKKEVHQRTQIVKSA